MNRNKHFHAQLHWMNKPYLLRYFFYFIYSFKILKWIFVRLTWKKCLQHLYPKLKCVSLLISIKFYLCSSKTISKAFLSLSVISKYGQFCCLVMMFLFSKQTSFVHFLFEFSKNRKSNSNNWECVVLLLWRKPALWQVLFFFSCD